MKTVIMLPVGYALTLDPDGRGRLCRNGVEVQRFAAGATLDEIAERARRDYDFRNPVIRGQQAQFLHSVPLQWE